MKTIFDLFVASPIICTIIAVSALFFLYRFLIQALVHMGRNIEIEAAIKPLGLSGRVKISDAPQEGNVERRKALISSKAEPLLAVKSAHTTQGNLLSEKQDQEKQRKKLPPK